MNPKSPLQVPNFIGSGVSSRPQSPSLCFSTASSKIDKTENINLCGCQHAPKSQCASAFGVLVLVLAYTALGSVLFVTLEGETEDGDMIETSVAASKPYPRHDLVSAEMRLKTVDRLWSITEDLNILYKENWTRLAAQEVLHFQDTILRAVRASRTQQVTNVQQHVRPYKWTYASAFLYSLTLITTIGFSGISPRTQWGRVAALIYALFGIPIILLYLSAIGEGLSSGMRCLFRRLRPFRSMSTSTNNSNSSSSSIGSVSVPMTSKANELQKRSQHQNYQRNWSHGGPLHDPCNYTLNSHLRNGIPGSKQTQSVVPISVCIMILICYVTLGAVIFHKLQPWGVLESLYFCFTSLGTIGFGDLMPKGTVAQYAASAYIIIGMAVVAMCFSLIQTELIIWLKKFAIPESLPSSTEDVALVSVTMGPVKS
ncbi:potassium channel subfamily K member 10-like [Anopheles ziemanni]|uniref:potassium channel subfamily K member 10-like n=1 Tax=Anopheles coustani TaxID=139045 RepID=UPI00265B6BFC|nr:potassium channel subfamily K member 10-like [Anopheles coustani]XP_058120557.1 potassium channel subfamily K member 10-like [Anopheles coustani]XP_058167871.1 potassium channel subfamily K member 10-like [Anopheles ziemanni]